MRIPRILIALATVTQANSCCNTCWTKNYPGCLNRRCPCHASGGAWRSVMALALATLMLSSLATFAGEPPQRAAEIARKNAEDKVRLSGVAGAEPQVLAVAILLADGTRIELTDGVLKLANGRRIRLWVTESEARQIAASNNVKAVASADGIIDHPGIVGSEPRLDESEIDRLIRRVHLDPAKVDRQQVMRLIVERGR